MWINLDNQQLDYVKGAMLALAEGNERDAGLFWTEELRETRERLEQEAKDYRAIAAKIDDVKSDFDPADPYRAAAREHADDDLEIDEDAIVSPGADPGAWVHAWIWITDEEAGLFTCSECSGEFTLDRRHCSVDQICDECAAKEDGDDEDELCEVCGEPLDESGDGWDGKCADCADIVSQDTYPENWTKDDG